MANYFTVNLPEEIFKNITHGDTVGDPVDKTISYKMYPVTNGVVNLVVFKNPAGCSQDNLAARFKIHLAQFLNSFTPVSVSK